MQYRVVRPTPSAVQTRQNPAGDVEERTRRAGLAAELAPDRFSYASGATSLFDVKPRKHLLELQVLCMKLFSQQPLEALVVCLQDGELVE